MRNFPRFFRRLYRELLIIFPLGLFIIFLINLLRPKSSFEISKDNLDHHFLAQELIAVNQFASAKKEARLANDKKLINSIETIENQPEEIEKEIIKMQKLAEQYPKYRDVYLKLAILNWKLYRHFDFKKYLDKALELDPNNEAIKKSFLL